MRHNQEPDPNRKCLMLRSPSVVAAIKQLLILVLGCPSPDFALWSSVKESTVLDDNGMSGGGDTLVYVAAKMERNHPHGSTLLELLCIHGTLL